ncbi:lysine biosynthesis protein LysW [Streptomyces sp. SPB162]|uniref:lysine biosynthesis protein LysW n=1 Tax=Streptomyces sp. SPB162 TaxID=2940560 RepID=UPI00240674DA|nr:lysine biosynthesis protein LysW [Streptomyces sp. SPB162]MDF9815304.1 alpha-aminoadipate carrier protein LysW [Streptomyces sp. SPB162]
MTTAVCPSCESDVALDSAPRQHEIVECAECRSELEILSVDPVLMALAPEAEEDWGE